MAPTSPSRMAVARRAAVEAGRELMQWFQKDTQIEELKFDRTLVTGADKMADQLISSIIREAFPEDGILSEENQTTYPESAHAWIIDPLDGTVNFSRGLHYWGVSIAHLENGIPTNAALYFPVVEELYTASAGTGAALNDKPLQISGNAPVKWFPIFFHCSRMHQKYQVRTKLKKRSLGAAAYHLCLIASGKGTAAFESTPRIWDLAGAWLVIREAGGVIAALEDQQPFPAHPGKDYARKPFAILAAESEDVFNQTSAGITRLEN